MRGLIGSVLSGGMAVGVSAGAFAQPPASQRWVQLISMSGARTPASQDNGAIDDVAASAVPKAFLVHDVSRRYVEYRMAQELAASAGPAGPVADVGPSPVPSVVAARSLIAVPGWMRGSYPVAPAIAYVPSCAPMAYRPSGFLSRAGETRRAAYYGMVSSIACEHGIPTGLFDALIMRESGYNPGALSPKSAFGFAQLMPGTALGLGINRFDPLQNLHGGARYLRQQLDKFGQVSLALAAYNAGPGRVKNGLVPRIAETQNYVADILMKWTRLSGGYQAAATHGLIVMPRVRTASIAAF